jgi:hypothetical protein
MSNPVCISPLKFYDSLAKQSHRKSYAYGHISPLITKTGWIPPFQFVIPTQDYINGGGLVKAVLCNAKNDSEMFDLSQLFLRTGDFSIRDIDNYKTVIFTGGKKSADYIIEGVNSYEQGTVSDGTNQAYPAGELLVMPSRISSRYNTVAANKSIHYKVADGYRAAINSWDGNSAIITDKSGWVTGEGTWTPQNRYIFIIVSKSNGEDNISPSEGLNAITIHSSGIPEGLYYLKLASGNGGLWTYYSEVFCFDNVTKDCLELEYWNETGNFAVKNGVIAFPADFHFKLLLKGEIGKPEYNFEEESTKRLGYIFVESQVSKKTYKFNAVVPEYICDALRLVRLCDNKIIRCKDDEYEAITFEMEAEWQTQGDLASVTCEFETDNVVANIGGFVPDKLGGDYNNDYNEDFDKE